MKKLLCVLAFILIISIPKVAWANTYVNQNGVEMTQEQYLDLLKIYSEKHISVLDQDKFNEIMNMGLDFDNVKQDVRYIKTEYNQVTGAVNNSEISKEEYDNVVEDTQVSRSTMIETSYKRIALALTKTTSTYAYFGFNAIWKIMPKVRSFDVIGVRFSNLEVINATQGGRQIYDLNGTTSYVQYNWNGTNIKNLDNGFGISMNLLNSDVTYLECTIDSTLDVEGYPATLFASYQHAVEDVTLATSQNYSIGVGLGNVFVFNNNIGSKYDGMQGVYDYISSAS